MEMKKMAAPPLGAKVVDRLLDLLSTDDAFRALFVSDTYAALLQAGYEPPAGADENTVNPALCIYTPNLASKEKIARERGKLTRTSQRNRQLLVPCGAPERLKQALKRPSLANKNGRVLPAIFVIG